MKLQTSLNLFPLTSSNEHLSTFFPGVKPSHISSFPVQRLSLTVTRFSVKIFNLVFLARDRWYVSSLLFQLQRASKLNQESSYDDSLKERALLSLREIKKEIDARSFHKADMWCHLGTVIIRDPDEGALVYCNKRLLRRSFLQVLKFNLTVY